MHSYVILEKGMPLKLAQKAVVLLHGRGGSAEDIMSLKREFDDGNIYFAAPQAANNTWYPFSFLSPASINEPWLTSAIEVVKQLCDNILLQISSENLYIMGFSQGACLALEFAGRFAGRYGGVAALTGGLIGDILDKSIYKGDFEGTKIFLGNSDMDPHVPLDRSKQSKEILQSLGADVTLSVYPGMRHTISREEIADVKSFLGL